MSAILKEIVKVTRQKPYDKLVEKREEFLRRIHLAAQDISDDDWNTLSDPAQQWINDNSTALGELGKDEAARDAFIPSEPPDTGAGMAAGEKPAPARVAKAPALAQRPAAKPKAVETAAVAVEETPAAKDEQEEEAPAPEATGRRRVVSAPAEATEEDGNGGAAPAAAKSKKATKAAPVEGEPKRGGTVMFRRFAVRNPGATKDELMAQVRNAGYAISEGSANRIFDGARIYRKLYEQEGLLK